MPDIAKVLREEIQRLARKELKAALATLRKDNIALKRTVADHKRRIATLERDNKRLLTDKERRSKKGTGVTQEEVQKARVTAKMIRGMRAKLGLTQAELARLLGVTLQSVYQWERKEGRLDFRGNTKAAIVEIRKLNRKEAQQRLAALGEKKAPRRTRKPKSR